MPAEPIDSADLDALADLQQHRGHLLVTARLIDEIQRRCTDLELHRTNDAENTAYLRGYIKALRTARAIPTILREELKASLKEK